MGYRLVNRKIISTHNWRESDVRHNVDEKDWDTSHLDNVEMFPISEEEYNSEPEVIHYGEEEEDITF